MSGRSTDDRDLLAPADWSLWPKALPYLRPDWRWYLLAFVCAPASALLTIAQPWLLRKAIDEHITVPDLDGIERIALWFLAAVITAFVLEGVYTLAISYGALATITRLRRSVYEHTLNQSQAFFDVRPTGRLLTRVTSDVEALGETLSAGAMTIVLDVLLVGGILVAMALLEPKLTLVLLACAPFVALVLEWVRRALRRLYSEVRDSLADLNAFTSERLTGVEVVQLYSDEERALRQFGTRMDRYRDATIRTNVYDSMMYAIVDGISAITVALLLWYGGGDLLSGSLTAGTLFAFVDYTGKLFRPIQEFSAKVAILQRAGASLEKIFGLLDHDGAIHPGSRRTEHPQGHIVLKGVAFEYGEGKGVLKGVDFEVRPGEVVALVGRTGSGKSTIARLLTRTYDGYSGSMTLDGVEIADLDPKDVRRAIGMVRQDVQLFPGDVRQNLTLGADIADADLEEAIRVCHADVAVAKLGGLGGRVAHGGANLSVGEAQLLSFARTMAHDPVVVVLDEATASVDTLTEARIQAATEAVLERKTVVVIAHRLSTIVNADRIVLLSEGQVLETGSHEELLARDGRYAELFRQQFLDRSEAASGEACVIPLPEGRVVFLSGAGLSVASGIQTFRGAGGLWEGYEVTDVATPEAWVRDPSLVRRFYDARREAAARVQPNEGHKALARLQRVWGPERVRLVTQNVDGLLQRAGAIEVVEMHGSVRMLRCEADPDHPRVGIEGTQDPGVRCVRCGAPMRPAIVWFGEIPEHLDRIYEDLFTSDLFVSVGTSGVVYPAAGFVRVALQAGARAAEVNPEPSGGPFHHVVVEPSETALPRLVDTWLA